MSDERQTPENLTGADDKALGEALGSVIRGRVEAPASPPPVAHIAERAAARAKARNTRRAVVGIAASVAMVAGGFAAWNALDDDQPTEVIVVDDPAVTAEPASTAAPIDGPSDAPSEASADRTEPATPESLSTGPVLEWTEFDPASVFGTDASYFGRIESLGDGRVLVEVYSTEGTQVMVSENGVDWTEVSMPPDFSLEQIDIVGDRWLVSGWPEIWTRMPDSISQVLFSDDQGATWTELAIPLDPADENETSSVAAALVSGENMVVAVIGHTRPDVATVIVARGLVPDKESIQGWIGVEGDTVSFTRDHDESTVPESFELTAEEEDFLYGGIQTHVRLYFSDGGPAELVAAYPGWDTKGYGADDGFHLTLINEEGQRLLTSPDGRHWGRSPLVDGDGVPVGQVYAYSGSHQQTIWTAGPTGLDYRVKRSEGVYAPSLVAAYPDGIRFVDRLAVGPAGIAAVAEAGSLPELGRIPEMRLAKDGYELRYNEPVGGFTLWDLSEGAPVYVFDFESLQGDTLPEGVRTVEDDAGGQGNLVFEHPETGEDLVSFNLDDLESALMASLPDPDEPLSGSNASLEQPERPERWVGWSADGTNWGWQAISDAFDLGDLTAIDPEFTEIDLAVGGDFVIARVRTYEVEPSDVVGDEEGDTAVEATPHPPRWFIATVE
ncbi:MAG: hypothetical protein KTV68_00055 [Acidimicrobiia bacterium]|nr:hypothetical protein [Acidimicrobiia bacterium]MCY4433042.1 hypothetical protein [bacterium]